MAQVVAEQNSQSQQNTELEPNAESQQPTQEPEILETLKAPSQKQSTDDSVNIQASSVDANDRQVIENQDDTTISGSNAESGENSLTIFGTPEYENISFRTERSGFVFMSSLRAPYFRETERAPIDLVCVLDESGSMGGAPLELCKKTMTFIVKNLEHSDNLCIIGYGSHSRIILPLTRMDHTGKEHAQQLITQISTHGSTALCAGLVQGVQILKNRTQEASNEVASVMLLTDGRANVGPKTATEIISALEGRIHVEGISGSRQSVPNLSQINRQQQQQQQQQQQKRPNRFSLRALFNRQDPNLSNNTQGGESDQIVESDQKERDTHKGETISYTINTFGFGTNHNESLLEAIAEYGRGMYTFIENTDMIADTFAECLGGLVSVVGQNLKLRIECVNNVHITKMLSTGFDTDKSEDSRVYEVTLPDLQSEENRDLLFECVLPSLPEPQYPWEFARFRLDYNNAISGRKDMISCICKMNRSESEETGERNFDVDTQHNRILAVEALETADQLAQSGQIEDARNIVLDAQKRVLNSRSRANPYVQNLASDMQEALTTNLRTREEYHLYGSKAMKSGYTSHKKQRANMSSRYESQNAYTNSSRINMKSRFS